MGGSGQLCFCRRGLGRSDRRWAGGDGEDAGPSMAPSVSVSRPGTSSDEERTMPVRLRTTRSARISHQTGTFLPTTLPTALVPSPRGVSGMHVRPTRAKARGWAIDFQGCII